MLYGIITENQAAALAACLYKQPQFVRLLIMLLPLARKADDLNNARDRANAVEWIGRNGVDAESVRFVSISTSQAGKLLAIDGKNARYHLRHLEDCGAIIRIAEPTGTCSALYALAVPEGSRGSVSPNNADPLAKPQGVGTRALGGRYKGSRGSVSPNNADPTINHQLFTKGTASAPGSLEKPASLPPDVPTMHRFTESQMQAMPPAILRVAREYCPQMLPDFPGGGETA